jgi:hypothetical protein
MALKNIVILVAALSAASVLVSNNRTTNTEQPDIYCLADGNIVLKTGTPMGKIPQPDDYLQSDTAGYCKIVASLTHQSFDQKAYEATILFIKKYLAPTFSENLLRYTHATAHLIHMPAHNKFVENWKPLHFMPEYEIGNLSLLDEQKKEIHKNFLFIANNMIGLPTKTTEDTDHCYTGPYKQTRYLVGLTSVYVDDFAQCLKREKTNTMRTIEQAAYHDAFVHALDHTNLKELNNTDLMLGFNKKLEEGLFAGQQSLSAAPSLEQTCAPETIQTREDSEPMVIYKEQPINKITATISVLSVGALIVYVTKNFHKKLHAPAKRKKHLSQHKQLNKNELERYLSQRAAAGK